MHESIVHLFEGSHFKTFPTDYLNFNNSYVFCIQIFAMGMDMYRAAMHSNYSCLFIIFP